MAILRASNSPEAGGVEEALSRLGASTAHIELAMARKKSSGESLAKIMRDYGLVSVEKVARAIAAARGVPYISPDLVDQIDAESIRRHGIATRGDTTFVPVAIDKQADGKLTVYVAVSDERQENEIRNLYYPNTLKIVFASAETVQLVYRRYFANTEKEFFEEYARAARDEGGGQAYNRMLELLLRHACYTGASDIHFSPSASSGVILLRVDGVRQTFAVLKHEELGRLTEILRTNGRVNNVQGLADASLEDVAKDLAERYGFRLELGSSIKGDTAVIRILDRHGSTVDFDSIGFDAESAENLRRYVKTSAGLVLVTGPTGSGKTTTLYSLLKLIDPLERSVQTIENPVEYQCGTWFQYEVKRGQTAAEGSEWGKLFKGLLRNDPDVILLGEVRDEDTAKTCIDAANTGHLVFTTLHTNSAVMTISRLRELGVDADSLSNVLLGVVAQRLVRKLCACAVPDTREETLEELNQYSVLRGVKATPRRPQGCPRCGHTGYRGRRMIYEVMDVKGQKVQQVIAGGRPSTEILANMPANRRMWVNGLSLVAKGETSIDELNRVAVKES